jgi:hypothetical protein
MSDSELGLDEEAPFGDGEEAPSEEGPSDNIHAHTRTWRANVGRSIDPSAASSYSHRAQSKLHSFTEKGELDFFPSLLPFIHGAYHRGVYDYQGPIFGLRRLLGGHPWRGMVSV